MLGYKETLKALRASKSKLVLIAGNCSVLRKSEVSAETATRGRARARACLPLDCAGGSHCGTLLGGSAPSAARAHVFVGGAARPTLRRRSLLSPPLTQIEYFAMLSKTTVHQFAGTNVELGTACGKLFRTGIVSIQDAGDSDILRTLGSA